MHWGSLNEQRTSLSRRVGVAKEQHKLRVYCSLRTSSFRTQGQVKSIYSDWVQRSKAWHCVRRLQIHTIIYGNKSINPKRLLRHIMLNDWPIKEAQVSRA